MLKTRILTALIILPLALTAICLSDFTRISLALLIFIIINYEFLTYSTTLNFSQLSQTIISISLIPLGFLWNSWEGFAAGIIIGSALIFVFQLIDLEREDHLIPFEKRLPAICFAFLYTGVIGSLVVIVANEFSAEKILYVLALVIITDTAAYFAGKSIGGMKLSPRISPNKTVSGAFAGVLAAILSSLILVELLGLSGKPLTHLFFALLVAVLSIYGDLLESLSKRIYGVKDAGSLLPGHGGLLDRIDGFLFAIISLFLVSF